MAKKSMKARDVKRANLAEILRKTRRTESYRFRCQRI